jgi:hypothetical protein
MKGVATGARTAQLGLCVNLMCAALACAEEANDLKKSS